VRLDAGNEASMLWLPLALALASPAAAAFADGRGAAAGTWGGDTLILEVVADGADLEFECARGRITKPLKLDRHSDFDLPGTFSPEGHGPIRDGPAADKTKTQYQGHIDGDP
jgi:hypothetical protein